VLQWNAQAKRAGVRRRVFCASLADVFDAEAPEGALPWLWELIRVCDWLDFLMLTKRADRIALSLPASWWTGGPWRNVWLGVTAEDQRRWNERIPLLQDVPAVVRFVSVEPQVDEIKTLRADLHGIHWMIMGGESGGGARPYDMTWTRRLLSDCLAAGVAPFVKQIGAKPYVSYVAMGEVCTSPLVKLGDRKGGTPEEWPPDLRVREFPRRAAA
jgi:protein gp37